MVLSFKFWLNLLANWVENQQIIGFKHAKDRWLMRYVPWVEWCASIDVYHIKNKMASQRCWLAIYIYTHDFDDYDDDYYYYHDLFLWLWWCFHFMFVPTKAHSDLVLEKLLYYSMCKFLFRPDIYIYIKNKMYYQCLVYI